MRAGCDDGHVWVEVEDNGPGIPESVQHRVFDAFFTTKPPGRGTGLGLQISQRIVVLEHGGDLSVTSRPGRTTFRVVLPPEPPTTPVDAAGKETAMGTCDHLEHLSGRDRPDEVGCPECLAAGDTWVHLRWCDACGHVGCCDDSINRHARAHAVSAGHPVVHSLEPGETWAWCYLDEVGVQRA